MPAAMRDGWMDVVMVGWWRGWAPSPMALRHHRSNRAIGCRSRTSGDGAVLGDARHGDGWGLYEDCASELVPGDARIISSIRCGGESMRPRVPCAVRMWRQLSVAPEGTHWPRAERDCRSESRSEERFTDGACERSNVSAAALWTVLLPGGSDAPPPPPCRTRV